MIVWNEFWTGFLANVASDIIIAIAIYIAITRPGEKKDARERTRQALGLLKAEMEVNLTRAKHYSEILRGNSKGLKKLSPLRYTRGAWNALKESGFLVQLNDPMLVYNLLRVNEAIVVADSSLFKVISAVRDEKPTRLLVPRAKHNNELLVKVLEQLLVVLEDMKLPKFVGNDLYDIDNAS